jgi:drug/metabolite transporter (DMT)-like permease
VDFALLAGMGVFQLALGFLLFARGAPLLTPAEVGLLTLLEVVISPLWVWIGIGEVPGQTTFLGGGIILGALVVHSAYGIRRSKPPVGMA